jgi:hypothetical protein
MQVHVPVLGSQVPWTPQETPLPSRGHKAERSGTKETVTDLSLY